MKKSISIKTYTGSDGNPVTSKITKYAWGTYVEYKCIRCNRFFKNLNLHDKTSRCGRSAGFQKGLTASDKERIAAVGLEVAIKRNQK